MKNDKARNDALEEAAAWFETRAIFYCGADPVELVPSESGEPVLHLVSNAIRNLKTNTSGLRYDKATRTIVKATP